MTGATPSLGIIQRILDGSEDGMPRKYQNATLEVRRDVKRPYYFVRVTIPTANGRRKRVARCLGFVDEIPKKEALKRRAEALEVVNAGRVLLQAQIRFKDLVGQFIAARLPQLGTATQGSYRSHIEQHILPAFGESV
jgi:hypothetical protein